MKSEKVLINNNIYLFTIELSLLLQELLLFSSNYYCNDFETTHELGHMMPGYILLLPMKRKIPQQAKQEHRYKMVKK